ncbi:LysE family translocator [Hahella sp. KA22]|uniref:LysE family translocator n=1 Tax=Hahella sp. KA22 TaxID=1628392 RepID=UPI000FDD8094|nr:LysE family transporter [Hahella sp. KA22]AZZ94501.1 LysE family translocator [Hahella sp. KA22]QAY57874.1 LysE family translocator [Hahella sp. KA22]
MHEYWTEFLTVALAHLLAVASPGPDFAVVMRQSLCRGLKPALWTSTGIGSGILLHITYSLLGIGLLISQSVVAFNVLKWIGAAYLIWVGFQCLRAKPQAPSDEPLQQALPSESAWQAFRLGFLTNVLNPKATLFFVALFSVVISPDTPKWVQGIYGGWMFVATTLWFCGFSFFLSGERVRRVFQRCSHWIERVMGVVLFGLAARLFAATRD